MIHTKTVVTIQCDKCKTTLTHPNDSIALSFRGQVVEEDTNENIKSAAKLYNWKLNEYVHFCPECSKGK